MSAPCTVKAPLQRCLGWGPLPEPAKAGAGRDSESQSPLCGPSLGLLKRPRPVGVRVSRCRPGLKVGLIFISATWSAPVRGPLSGMPIAGSGGHIHGSA